MADPNISIHAPREGCDGVANENQWHDYGFQSTHPVRGATGRVGTASFAGPISIHAPREGCDQYLEASCAPMPYFNPRTP